MFTKVQTISEIKQLLTEIVLNRTEKANVIEDNSVLGALLFGNSKLFQKAQKDNAIVESHLFPDFASGTHLDFIANYLGIAARYGSAGSSTWVRLVGDVGTVYPSTTTVFNSQSGQQFELVSDVTIGAFGYSYAKVQSVDVEEKTNVEPLNINSLSPEPTKHKYVINEYQAVGGRDNEDDDSFRKRIKEGANIVATKTLNYLKNVFQQTNPLVLRIINEGIDSNGRIVLSLVSANGQDFSQAELDTILENSLPYFALTDLRVYGESYNIILQNVSYYLINAPTGIDFRAAFEANYDPDEVRKEIQIKITKSLDFRFWENGKKIEWDDLLGIVKSVAGVKYIPDNHFYPNVDLAVPNNSLPRFSSFIIRDLDGNIIINNSGTLNPVFFQDELNGQ